MMNAALTPIQLSNNKPLFQSSQLLLWISIASIVMLFAGLTSGYIVRQAEGNWVIFDLPQLLYVSTGIILASSVTMFLAVRAVRNSRAQTGLFMLITTLILGCGFAVTQYLSWQQLTAQGIHFVGNPSGSFFYVISGLHLAHLVGGLIFLIFAVIKVHLKKYSPAQMTGLNNCANYWHFLDGLWIYLFLFLLLIR